MSADDRNSPAEAPKERIALALSGGGARAMAFHLGCLKALNSAGILQRVEVITSVSGGSVLAALYCTHPGNFDDFEKRARAVLAEGFFWSAIRTALTTTEGVKAVFHFVLLIIDRLAALIVKPIVWLGLLGGKGRWPREPVFIRRASRTTILLRTFDRVLGRRMLSDLRKDRPRLVLIACELRAKAAFYFSASALHCWRYGTASSDGIRLADAVAASAAYPLALPAIDTTMSFRKGAMSTSHRITLTDGGVYDNLGLAPLWPGRDATISLDIGQFDRIIACRAGYALEVGDPAATMIPRLSASFESLFARSQNFAMARLFELTEAKKLKGFLLPYLGQNDGQLTHAPRNLVTGEEAAGYPTNFDSMTSVWVNKLSQRGEQLVGALLRQHWGDVLR